MKLLLSKKTATPLEIECIATLAISNNPKHSTYDTMLGLRSLGMTNTGDRLLFLTTESEINNHKLTPKKLRNFASDITDNPEGTQLICFKHDKTENRIVPNLKIVKPPKNRRRYILIKCGDTYGLTTSTQLIEYTRHLCRERTKATLQDKPLSLNFNNYCHLLRLGRLYAD